MFSKEKNKVPPVYQPFKAIYLNFLEDIADLKDRSFAELANEALSAAHKENFKEAYKFSAALEYYFGVPGLILKHKINVKSLIEREKDGEYLESGICNAFINLLLAESLLKDDPQASLAMKNNFPKEDISRPSYFQEKKDELLKFFPLTPELLKFCEKAANDLASDCLPKKIKANLKK